MTSATTYAPSCLQGRTLSLAISALLATVSLAPSIASAGASVGDTLEEIVVTAEKRVSTVQSTPISITAVSGEQLAARGISTVEELAATTPGISMRTAGPGQTELEIRGLSSSGGAAPTVGFYLDEVPLSPAAASLNGRVVIDPDLYDLGRVEVLRGPQGTLYGSGSMGGTIKLIANPPDPTKFAASVQGLLSETGNGGGTNYGGNLMLNMPLNDSAAVRLVLTDKFTDGWINRAVVSPFPFPSGTCPGWAGTGCVRGDVTAAPVQKVIARSNATQVQSARVSLLWKPLNGLSTTTTAMYQRITAAGYNQFQDPPGVGSLALYQPFDLKEPVSDTFKMLSEVITYDLSFAQLTSATSYWNRQENQSQDSTEALQNLFALPNFYPVLYTENDYSEQTSEELRLASSGDGAWEWVAGGFFSNLRSTYAVINQSPDYAQFSVGGAAANPQGLIFNANNPYTLKQYALFGDASYKFSSEWKLTGGLRWFDYKTVEEYSTAGLGTQSGNAQATTGSINSAAHGFNPKATLSYTPTKDLTIYSTIARGFRPGGVSLPVPTSGLTVCPSVPLNYGPDNVWNYEVGEKMHLLDGRLTVNSDIYYIQWNNIQQLIELSCGYPYTANAGKARSYGPELELSVKVTDSLTLDVSGTYTNATITSAAAGTGIADGTKILNIPKETASAMLVYTRPITDSVKSVSRLTDSYVGSQSDIAYLPLTLPSHNFVDFRTGLVFSNLTAYLVGTNLTNKTALLTANNTSFAWQQPTLTRYTTNQPRTIGLDVQYRY